jgi:uncharacterized cupin superfamily protein
VPDIINYSSENLLFENSPLEEYQIFSSKDVAKSSGLHGIKGNLRLLKSGKYSCPYHFHHADQEIFVILEGKGMLRTEEGLRIIKKGDTLFFPAGKAGAHQVKNDSEEDLVYLDLKIAQGFDACEYPDTNKINLNGNELFEKGRVVDYFEGESSLSAIWKTLKNF